MVIFVITLCRCELGEIKKEIFFLFSKYIIIIALICVQYTCLDRGAHTELLVNGCWLCLLKLNSF